MFLYFGPPYVCTVRNKTQFNYVYRLFVFSVLKLPVKPIIPVVPGIKRFKTKVFVFYEIYRTSSKHRTILQVDNE